MEKQPQVEAPRIAQRLFVEEPEVRLIGGRHRVTGRIVFPCPAQDAFDPTPLSPRGALWSYTVQRFRPKSPPYAGPEVFEPFAVGYVELPGEVIVETRIVGVPFEDLRIGLPMIATTETFIDASGVARVSYAFTAAREPTV